jgi:hypothetical protein
MVSTVQTALLEQTKEKSFAHEMLRPSPADLRQEMSFLVEVNRDLTQNACLTRLNEDSLERIMEKLDSHVPICRYVYGHTRARIHELLLLCAANYANNCEYGAVGDLMFNPRLMLVHIRGRHDPVVKERHTFLTEQLMGMAETRTEVVMLLKGQTALETRKKPLIPHSYEILERYGTLTKDYLGSARDRASRIADLTAWLCCEGFKDRLDLEAWLRRASPSDRALIESRLIPLDWTEFHRLGGVIYRTFHHLFDFEEKTPPSPSRECFCVRSCPGTT